MGDLGSIPESGRSPGEEKGYPLQYSGLENSMDCIVHGVTKSPTQLSDFHKKNKYIKDGRVQSQQQRHQWYNGWETEMSVHLADSFL